MAEDALLILLALAFTPPLLYLAGLAWRHPGPSARMALSGFAYGATLSIGVLLVVYALMAVFLGDPVRAFQGFFAERHFQPGTDADFVTVVVLAPLTEELAKGLGVFLLAWRLSAGRDGVMVGAAVGLGFAAIETTFYLAAAWAQGDLLVGGVLPLSVLVVAGVRSISAAFLHPAATGLLGWGIARARLRGAPVLLAALPFYLMAVVLHGLYNYLAAFLPPQEVLGVSLSLNLLAALLLASVAWRFTKRGVAVAR